MQSGIHTRPSRVEGQERWTGSLRHRPQSVAGALLIAALLPDPLAWAWWGLCSTGMRVGEFWGAWEPADGALRIPEAGPGGSRAVPLMAEIRRPECSASEFREGLHRASDGELDPEDARRTFESWMRLAGVPADRRRHYLGRGSGGAIAADDLALDRGRLERFLQRALTLE